MLASWLFSMLQVRIKLDSNSCWLMESSTKSFSMELVQLLLASRTLSVEIMGILWKAWESYETFIKVQAQKVQPSLEAKVYPVISGSVKYKHRGYCPFGMVVPNISLYEAKIGLVVLWENKFIISRWLRHLLWKVTIDKGFNYLCLYIDLKIIFFNAVLLVI